MDHALPAPAHLLPGRPTSTGSLTAAAEELGYAQPSVSEQIRALEKSLGVQLFRRVGRGVVPTTVADTLRPHAERVLAAVEETRRAVQRVKAFETGTIRFGMFGTARLYAGAGLVADVLSRYPGVRVELIGQNSIGGAGGPAPRPDRGGDDRRAAVEQRGPRGHPGGPRRARLHQRRPRRTSRRPVTAHRLAEASLVMPETTWRADDSTRLVLRQMLHETGRNPQTRIEVEDVETAVELVGMGYADSVIPRGAAEQLLPRLAPKAGWVSLRPRQYDMFAIVHRAGATLSPAAQLMIELATTRIQAIAEPIREGGDRVRPERPVGVVRTPADPAAARSPAGRRPEAAPVWTSGPSRPGHPRPGVAGAAPTRRPPLSSRCARTAAERARGRPPSPTRRPGPRRGRWRGRRRRGRGPARRASAAPGPPRPASGTAGRRQPGPARPCPSPGAGSR